MLQNMVEAKNKNKREMQSILFWVRKKGEIKKMAMKSDTFIRC